MVEVGCELWVPQHGSYPGKMKEHPKEEGKGGGVGRGEKGEGEKGKGEKEEGVGRRGKGESKKSKVAQLPWVSRSHWVHQ